MNEEFEKIENWMISMGLDVQVPSAYEIWKKSNAYYRMNDIKKAKLYQNMNSIFHNSSIPYTVRIGKEVNFAYGGI